MRIVRIWEQCEGTKTFEFDGKVDAKAGQFVMALAPGVSENPFTVAYDNPLRITVKARGEDDGKNSFTNHLFGMQEGDALQITGPMGNGYTDLIEINGKHHHEIYVITGGCGAAGLPLLDKEMGEVNKRLFYIAGARTLGAVPNDIFELENYHRILITTEDGSFGKKGTVADAIDEVDFEPQSQAIICGPRGMITSLAAKLYKHMKPADIIVSIEPYMKCGRGVCGSCEVGGYHACTDGPNFRYSDFLTASDFEFFRRRKSGVLEPL